MLSGRFRCVLDCGCLAPMANDGTMRPPKAAHSSMQLETVGEIVRVLRSRRGLEQVELARACGWRDASAVSRIETDRIKPTRRTLLKLSQNLADGTTGPASEILAWLFQAAGVLPTPRDVEAVESQLPPIDRWIQPAILQDFGWYTWRANEPFRALTGLPERYVGRNYLEMLFEAGGSMRARLADRWERVAKMAVQEFRIQTDRRASQRWHRKLLVTLEPLPDFARIWGTAGIVAAAGIVFNWSRSSTEVGSIGMMRSHVIADPRLWVTQLVPEDASGNEFMLKGAYSQE
jgi:transcriptional regulator with XRE-family HTH domain